MPDKRPPETNRPFGDAPGASGAPAVSIVIPTYNRPDQLIRALESVRIQKTDASDTIEIVVVDNSADGNALPLLAKIAAGDKRLKLIHEPQAGVANARNAGVSQARGEWVAFLDDDEEAAPGWLKAHLATARTSGADATFGPVRALGEKGLPIGAFACLHERHFKGGDGEDLAAFAARLGTNNSMFHRARCLKGGAPFDPSLNECGGEDTLLLQSLLRDQRRFVWSSHAHVTEWVPLRRLNWSYFTRRKFLSGQIRSFVHSMLSPPEWRAVLFWMLVGLAQLVAGTVFATILWFFDRQTAMRFRASAYGGLGKIFWMKRFRPGLYGKGLVS